MSRDKANLGLGLVAIGLALVAVLAWVPNDTATGVIVAKRGRVSIGDAMAPMAAFGLVALAGLLILFEKTRTEGAARLSAANVRFLLLLTGVFLLTMVLMRWSGPAVTGFGQLAGLTEHGYRDLRDTVPWKYIGFVIGGTTLVASLMSLVERRVTWRAILVGLLAVAALIAVFDLPFPDLLLPPNGDT
ncbi:hypothetical protein E0K89_000645 [Aquicoccus sp. SCR17]|nr:hypothetical protein [Carideicomes alvinocaridis]